MSGIGPRKNSAVFQRLEQLTQQGAECVTKGQTTQALAVFEEAYSISRRLNDPRTEGICAFNLGAVLIALKDSAKGLELLQKASNLSGLDRSSGDKKLNGDLYYNLALGYEHEKKWTEAEKYYSLALEEYAVEISSEAVIESCQEKLAYIYAKQQKHDQSARMFEKMADSCASLRQKDKQVSALYEKGNQLNIAGRSVESLEAADHCLVLCSRMESSTFMVSIYNDLGLLYTHLKQYLKAEQCFQQAYPLSCDVSGQTKQQAVILQNLAAIYNFLGDYQRAVSTNALAVTKYAETGNRALQGHCFYNQAFAYSQLSDVENASISLHHALQAAQDSKDHASEWQVMESLGMLHLNRGSTAKAVHYFKGGLRALTATRGSVRDQERMINKLTHALQNQLGTAAGRNGASQMMQAQSVKHRSVKEREIVPIQATSTQVLAPTLRRGPLDSASDATAASASSSIDSKIEKKYRKYKKLLSMRAGSKKFKTVPRGLSVDLADNDEAASAGSSDTESTYTSNSIISRHNSTSSNSKLEAESMTHRKTKRRSLDDRIKSAFLSSSSSSHSTLSSSHASDVEENASGLETAEKTVPSETVESVYEQEMTSQPVSFSVSHPAYHEHNLPRHKTSNTSQADSIVSSRKPTGTLLDIDADDSGDDSGPATDSDDESDDDTEEDDDDEDMREMKRKMKTFVTASEDGRNYFNVVTRDIENDADHDGENDDDQSSDCTSVTPEDDDDSDVTDDANSAAHTRSIPALPSTSPLKTLTGTYETPQFEQTVYAQVTKKSSAPIEPDYAEIDFESTQGLADTIQGASADDTLYETINPKTEVIDASSLKDRLPKLPRAEREWLLYKYQMNQLKKENEQRVLLPEEPTRTRMCRIM